MPELPRPQYTTISREHTHQQTGIAQALSLAGVCLDRPETVVASLPFAVGDVTAGSESELQAVVAGDKRHVDLPLIIEQSNYFANMMKRAASGETSQRAVADLERFLTDNNSNVWENSWVRFPLKRLSAYARQVLDQDLLADKQNPAAGQRADAARFFFHAADGTVMLRLPISYLIKLALADLIGSQQILPDLIRQTGIRLLGHYLNDNTSPETFSFNVVSLTPHNGMGAAIARETAIRFLMTQLLLHYANQAGCRPDSRLFCDRGFIFFGSTKKVAYAGNMEGVEVIPVQALTAVLYTACGLLAMLLFLASHHAAAFLLATTVTQGWRSFSETLRADYRGEGRISAYQIMGIIGVLYAFAMAWLLGGDASAPAQLAAGLQSIWSPALILFLQGIWCVIFFYTGRSTVTGATLSFHIHHDRI